MPDVAVGQFISTEEIVTQEKVVDMDPKMRLLDPDQTQFVTMTSARSPTRDGGEGQLARGAVHQPHRHAHRRLHRGRPVADGLGG